MDAETKRKAQHLAQAMQSLWAYFEKHRNQANIEGLFHGLHKVATGVGECLDRVDAYDKQISARVKKLADGEAVLRGKEGEFDVKWGELTSMVATAGAVSGECEHSKRLFAARCTEFDEATSIRETVLQEKATRLEKQEADCARQLRQIEEERSALQADLAANKKIQEEIKKKQPLLDRRGEELEAKQTDLDQQGYQMAEKQDQLDLRDSGLDDRESGLDHLEGWLNGRDEKSQTREARLKKLQATLAVVKALQDKRDDRLNQLQTRLQAREAGLDDREVEFSHRETWLNQLQANLSDLEVELETREAGQAAQLRLAREKLQRDTQEGESRREALQADVDTRRAALDNVLAQITELMGPLGNQPAEMIATLQVRAKVAGLDGHGKALEGVAAAVKEVKKALENGTEHMPATLNSAINGTGDAAQIQVANEAGSVQTALATLLRQLGEKMDNYHLETSGSRPSEPAAPALTRDKVFLDYVESMAAKMRGLSCERVDTQLTARRLYRYLFDMLYSAQSAKRWEEFTSEPPPPGQVYCLAQLSEKGYKRAAFSPHIVCPGHPVGGKCIGVTRVEKEDGLVHEFCLL